LSSAVHSVPVCIAHTTINLQNRTLATAREQLQQLQASHAEERSALDKTLSVLGPLEAQITTNATRVAKLRDALRAALDDRKLLAAKQELVTKQRERQSEKVASSQSRIDAGQQKMAEIEAEVRGCTNQLLVCLSVGLFLGFAASSFRFYCVSRNSMRT
jgi:hypothetical protein